jgi:hypothetical protein
MWRVCTCTHICTAETSVVVKCINILLLSKIKKRWIEFSAWYSTLNMRPDMEVLCFWNKANLNISTYSRSTQMHNRNERMLTSYNCRNQTKHYTLPHDTSQHHPNPPPVFVVVNISGKGLLPQNKRVFTTDLQQNTEHTP